jgi:GNAT superfamily N-acetyltransferase
VTAATPHTTKAVRPLVRRLENRRTEGTLHERPVAAQNWPVDVTIEQARPEDAGRIAALHVAAWKWAYQDVLPAEYLAGLDVAQRAVMWQGALETPAIRVWLGLVAGELAGFAATGPSRDAGAGTSTGEVGALYVREERCRMGVGSALLSACVRDLHGRGFHPLTAWVFEKNARALRFYEKHGWTKDGASRVETFAGRPVREVRVHLSRR